MTNKKRTHAPWYTSPEPVPSGEPREASQPVTTALFMHDEVGVCTLNGVAPLLEVRSEHAG